MIKDIPKWIWERKATFTLSVLLFVSAAMYIHFTYYSGQHPLNQPQKTEILSENTKDNAVKIFDNITRDKWRKVYKDPFVIHIRKALNGYLNGSNDGILDPQSVINPLPTDKEGKSGLKSFSKDYYKSKFVVITIAGNPFGGEEIQILFQNKPDKVFWVWVYKQGNGMYDLRGFAESNKFTKEDIAYWLNHYQDIMNDIVAL